MQNYPLFPDLLKFDDCNSTFKYTNLDTTLPFKITAKYKTYNNESEISTKFKYISDNKFNIDNTFRINQTWGLNLKYQHNPNILLFLNSLDLLKLIGFHFGISYSLDQEYQFTLTIHKDPAELTFSALKQTIYQDWIFKSIVCIKKNNLAWNFIQFVQTAQLESQKYQLEITPNNVTAIVENPINEDTNIAFALRKANGRKGEFALGFTHQINEKWKLYSKLNFDGFGIIGFCGKMTDNLKLCLGHKFNFQNQQELFPLQFRIEFEK